MNISEIIRLALQHYQSGDLQQAAHFFERTLAKQPNNAEILYFLEIVYGQLKNYDLAIDCLRRSLQLNSSNADAYFALGILMEEKGLIDEAINYLRKAVGINPNNTDARNRLGNALKEKGQFEESLMIYQASLQTDPTNPDTHYMFGTFLIEQGKQDDALDAFDTAIKYEPNHVKASLARCVGQIPIIYPDVSSMQSSRRRYHEELVNLGNKISIETFQNTKATAEAVGSHQPFYLAYQGLNDKDLQQCYGNMMCKIMASRYPQWADSPNMPLYSSEEPLRVGMVSRFFCLHSVWKIPIKGWIENLDRTRFRLYGYPAPVMRTVFFLKALIDYNKGGILKDEGRLTLKGKDKFMCFQQRIKRIF